MEKLESSATMMKDGAGHFLLFSNGIRVAITLKSGRVICLLRRKDLAFSGEQNTSGALTE